MATTTFLESGTDATQDLKFFAATSGTVASATDQAYTGPRSLKMGTGSPAATATASCTAGMIADSGTQISFYYRTDTLPAATASIFRTILSGTALFQLNLLTTGKLQNQPAGATAATGTIVLAVNTWYRICVSYYVTNTTTYTYKVYVNAVLDSTTNAGTLTNTGADTARFVLQSTAGANVNSWYDNIYIATGGASSASQPDTGNILITHKRPNANGTLNEYTTQIGAGGSGYGTGHSSQVNEQPLSTTNGWSIQNAAKKTEEYTIESASTGDVNIGGATITDYMGWVYTKVGVASTGNIIVGGTASNISVTTSYAMFFKAAGSTTYPAGSTDIGVDTNTVNQLFSLAECGINFAYTPGTAVAAKPLVRTLSTTGAGR